MSNTFVDEAEAIVEEVASRLAEEIQAVVDALSPDGRAYGTEKKSLNEQLDDYRLIRNDVGGWQVWVTNKALEVTNLLHAGGVAQDKIDAINPLAIALAYANDYSARMEKLLQERML